MFRFDALEALPYSLGKPIGSAGFKTSPEDFCVTEILGYAPPVGLHSEHLWLRIEKHGQNTQWVAQQLAKHFQRPIGDVSFAGLKDRNAVTQQWFSVRLAKLEQAQSLNIEGVSLLEAVPASKKLQRGALWGNQFSIRLRAPSNVSEVISRVNDLREKEFPNYYGAQRFGHDAGNLLLAERWRCGLYRPKSRVEREFLISATRAWLFNLQVAEAVNGAPMKTGFLFGQMRFEPPEEFAWLTELYQPQIRWLAKLGCRMQKRGLSSQAQNISVVEDGEDLVLRFELASGCYATSLLRELVQLH